MYNKNEEKKSEFAAVITTSNKWKEAAVYWNAKCLVKS